MDVPTGIQLEVEFLDRLSEPVREGKAKSVSDLIRMALQSFNFESVLVQRPSHVSMSVRLPLEVRRNLKRVAREKHTSVGQLVRVAVDAYLPHLEQAAAGQLEIEMPTDVPRAKAPAAPAGAPANPGRKKRTTRKRPAKPAARAARKPSANAKKARSR